MYGFDIFKIELINVDVFKDEKQAMIMLRKTFLLHKLKGLFVFQLTLSLFWVRLIFKTKNIFKYKIDMNNISRSTKKMTHT